MATQKWTSNNRKKSIVHFASRLIGISAQSDWLLDLAIDRYNTNNNRNNNNNYNDNNNNNNYDDNNNNNNNNI